MSPLACLNIALCITAFSIVDSTETWWSMLSITLGDRPKVESTDNCPSHPLSSARGSKLFSGAWIALTGLARQSDLPSLAWRSTSVASNAADEWSNVQFGFEHFPSVNARKQPLGPLTAAGGLTAEGGLGGRRWGTPRFSPPPNALRDEFGSSWGSTGSGGSSCGSGISR